ncbi:MAG TPA: DUF4238 domain-containing protein [Allosphingosinicella sp.]|nr:DUF4238 domain-containing protein [Allosphingosinicella sp.]
MAELKNQHFVPRAHFRPFSAGGAGKAINLYLIEPGRPIFGAPIKGQCARDYLYGKDGRIERLLGMLEGRYAKLIRDLTEPLYRLDDTDQWLLRYFTLLQSHRTAEQIARGLTRMEEMASFFRKAEEAHGQQWDPRHDPTEHRVMTELMLSFNEQMQERILDDLKVVIVRNRTARDFVTSDDPAVTTNRWLLQRKRVRIFGTNAAGLIMFLPLGPRLLAMNYDPAVYSVAATGRSGMVDLTRELDVLAFNEHQYMRAAEAIYFHRSEEAGAIAAEFDAAKPWRPSAWDSFRVARRDDGTDTHSRFSVGDPDEVARANEILFHLAREWPFPPRWPSILRFRANAHGFTKGRTIVRRAYMVASSAERSVYRRVT